jgi:hypothetical protein
VSARADAWTAVQAAVRSVPRGHRSIGWQPIVWTGGLAATAALTINLVAPIFQPAAMPVEPDPLRAFAPNAAAGLTPERANDPLAVLQKKVDRALDRIADERS